MWAGRMLGTNAQLNVRTIICSRHFLNFIALAAFRLEGVALDLLRRLPAIKKANLTRLMTEAGLDEK